MAAKKPVVRERESNAIPIHGGSSSSWGDSSSARLMGIVVDANNGLAQQVAENRTDLMDILSVETLSEPTDDLGLTLPFLAVYYDRPDMLEYLHKRGVNLKNFCDPMEYGNPLYYAIHMRKIRMIILLDLLGCSVKEPCDALEVLPETHAERLDDQSVKDAIVYASAKEVRASILFYKHFLRVKYRKIYLKKLQSIPLLQRCVRGFFGRRISKHYKAIKRALIRRIMRKRNKAKKIAEGAELNSDDEDSIIDESNPDITHGHYLAERYTEDTVA